MAQETLYEALEANPYYTGCRFTECSNPVYFLNIIGGSRYIIKATDDFHNEIPIAKFLEKIGVDTPRIIDFSKGQVHLDEEIAKKLRLEKLKENQRYIIFEHLDLDNAAKEVRDNTRILNPAKLAEAVADYHVKLYNGRHSEEHKREFEKITAHQNSEEEKAKNRFRRIFSNDNLIEKHIFEDLSDMFDMLPADEVGHNDLRLSNILSNGSRYCIIDNSEAGIGYFAYDLARLVMDIKTYIGKEIVFDEGQFKAAYLSKLNKGLNKSRGFGKSKREFEKEYDISKIVGGLGRATTLIKTMETGKYREDVHGAMATELLYESLEALDRVNPSLRLFLVDTLAIKKDRDPLAEKMLNMCRYYEQIKEPLIERAFNEADRFLDLKKSLMFGAVAGAIQYGFILSYLF